VARLRFRYRIGLLVAIAAAALVTVTTVTVGLGRQSKRELVGIETQYVPLIELDRDLKTAFSGASRALEDAANAADEARLADADQLGRGFLSRLGEGRATIIGNGGDPAVLEREFRDYYSAARAFAAAVIAGRSMTELAPQIKAMNEARTPLAMHLETATTPDRRRLAEAFASARASQETAELVEIVVAAAAIAMLVLLSWWITRRAMQSLQEVSAGVEQLARGEFSGEIRVVTSDEIGDLAREANQTAVRLRDYRERTERQALALAQARQAQQERADAAEAATKELEAFSYSVAHDLRAPLRSISGFSGALAEELGEQLEPSARAHLGRITGSAKRMGELIDALLELSRVSRAEVARQPVNLTKLSKDILAHLAAAEPDRRVTTIIADEVTATGDPNLLRALLENLLGNAWKFVSKTADPRIEVGVAEDGSYFVRDNGAGFDMAHATKLFAPFQRLHRETEYPGTGIGLATVQRIVRRHGGTIRAEAAVDKGAAFYFTLERTLPHA
jgi:signal transduction histidine kinase